MLDSKNDTKTIKTLGYYSSWRELALTRIENQEEQIRWVISFPSWQTKAKNTFLINKVNYMKPKRLKK